MHASPTKRRPIKPPAPMAAAAQHSRTRSDRVGGAAAAPAATPDSRRPLSIHGRPPPPAPSPATAPTPMTPAAKASAAPPGHHPSPIPAFLTNLRLLDLDLLDDWPAITPATFAGTTTQNHKPRVQAVEWALYRLFEIWDPEETASKLNPHFPAVDQLQSVSLRAALLRGLENAKKSGALGWDALIRKTMLDDCNGERLEEVLAAFSTAVLRKTLAARGPHRPLAVKLATDKDGPDDDGGHVVRPLALAYRVSLRRSLDRRREAAARYRDFGDLLAMKERGITRREEVLRARPPPAVSEDTCRRVRQTVRDNWTGNEAWMDALLAGDAARGHTGGLLGAPYDRVWRRVQQGRLAEIEDDARGGLLRQLDDRVEAQRQRLARWDELRRDMVGGGSRRNNLQSASSPLKRRLAARKPAQKGIDFRFNTHVDLHLGAAAVTGPNYGNEEALHQHYVTIMDELDQELTDIKTSSFEDAVQRLNNIRAQYGGSRADVSAHLSSDPISELSDLDEEEDVSDEHAPYYHHSQPHGTASAVAPRPVSMYAADRRTGYADDDGYSSASTSHAGTLRAGTTTDWDASSASSPPTSGGGFLDDAHSPSKAKPRHTLSLAERTRMSMARRSMQRLRDEEPEPEPPARRPTSNVKAPPEEEEEEEEEEVFDLVTRTQMSMAGFERAQQRARSERQREMRRELKRARALPPRREGSQWED